MNELRKQIAERLKPAVKQAKTVRASISFSDKIREALKGAGEVQGSIKNLLASEECKPLAELIKNAIWTGKYTSIENSDGSLRKVKVMTNGN